MLGEVYQIQPLWLSSQDIQIGVTVLTAAKEKPCLLPPALCRGYLCCLHPESSWQGAHPDSTEARQQCVPSLNVEGQSLRGCHCAETIGSLSSRSDCVFEYQKIGNFRHCHSSVTIPCIMLTHQDRGILLNSLQILILLLYVVCIWNQCLQLY